MLTHGRPITSILFEIVTISHSLFKCNYLKNKKYFLSFSFPLRNLHQILSIFKKKKIVVANIFPKLTTVQDSVRPLTKKHRVRTSFHNELVKVAQALAKSSLKHFYHIIPLPLGEKIRKIYP